MRSDRVDRRQEARQDEADAAFLDRVDVLVMGEWGRQQRGDNLASLHDDYAVRAEFLSVLGDLLMIRGATDCIAGLPTREELRRLLIAVRQEHLGQRDHGPLCTEGQLTETGWELPEDEQLGEWCLGDAAYLRLF